MQGFVIFKTLCLSVQGAAPYDGPPPSYTPRMHGPPCMPMAPPMVMHPNVKFGPNVTIHDPSRVKINGMPLTTAYPPQVVGMTMVGPGYQQTTGFVAGTGFQSMQSMQVGSKV